MMMRGDRKPKASLILYGFFPMILAISCARESGRTIFSRKDSITAVVTDSGLGGLSIMALAAVRLKEIGAYRSVDLVFANALFSNESGYNSLPDREAKIRVFDSALRGIARNTQPDIILIGCNTLSVLIEDVPFVQASKIPVVGIVDAGVEMIARSLAADPDSAVILFGTETTIAEGTHKQKLIARGFAKERIIPQACPELAAYIETDWKGDDAALLIEAFVDEAMEKSPDRQAPAIAALVCTHYGYAVDLWKKALAARGANLKDILNPNEAMIDAIFPTDQKSRFPETTINARVLSMVEIAGAKRASLGEWLARISPEVAAALRDYKLKPDLFPWKDLI